MKNFILPCLFAVAASLAYGQQGADIVGRIVGGQKAVIAIPDFRGAGRAGNFAATFNETLFSDIDQAGVFKMAPKSMFPLNVPQRPEDFRKPLQYDPNNRTRAPWLLDWSEPPVSSDFLAFGYTAEQDNQMVLFGWLFNVRQPEVSGAQVIGKIYHGSLDEEGARKVAHEFATDILRQFGVESLAGSKIYFVSNESKTVYFLQKSGHNAERFAGRYAAGIHQFCWWRAADRRALARNRPEDSVLQPAGFDERHRRVYAGRQADHLFVDGQRLGPTVPGQQRRQQARAADQYPVDRGGAENQPEDRK
jgi:hypothetical protein